MPHLFLTGEKHIGKSTLIKELLTIPHGPTGGFLTVRTNTVFPGTHTVHMLRPETNETPSPENLLFFCREKNGADEDRQIIAENFERLGTKTLTPFLDSEKLPQGFAKSGVIIMHEIGPREANAEHFLDMIRTICNRKYPQVLGVLQKGDTPLTDYLKQNRRVILTEVTKENRNSLLPKLDRLFYHFDEIPSYGAIVIEPSEKGPAVLMVGGYRGWTFPKGHQDLGETPIETAKREILEETGLSVDIDSGFSRVVKSARPQDENTVTFFAGRSLLGLKAPTAQVSEVAMAAWIPVSYALDLIGYPPDKEALLDALSYFYPHRYSG